jgi:hypothetical protein
LARPVWTNAPRVGARRALASQLPTWIFFGSLKEFLETLPASIGHYGRFGILTLMAGYRGNLVDADGLSPSVRRSPIYPPFVTRSQISSPPS